MDQSPELRHGVVVTETGKPADEIRLVQRHLEGDELYDSEGSEEGRFEVTVEDPQMTERHQYDDTANLFVFPRPPEKATAPESPSPSFTYSADSRHPNRRGTITSADRSPYALEASKGVAGFWDEEGFTPIKADDLSLYNQAEVEEGGKAETLLSQSPDMAVGYEGTKRATSTDSEGQQASSTSLQKLIIPHSVMSMAATPRKGDQSTLAHSQRQELSSPRALSPHIPGSISTWRQWFRGRRGSAATSAQTSLPPVSSSRRGGNVSSPRSPPWQHDPQGSIGSSSELLPQTRVNDDLESSQMTGKKENQHTQISDDEAEKVSPDPFGGSRGVATAEPEIHLVEEVVSHDSKEGPRSRPGYSLFPSTTGRGNGTLS